MADPTLSLDLATLRAAYRSGQVRPTAVIDEVLERITARDDDAVWIHRLDRDVIAAYLRALDGRDPTTMPLYGVPFAIKDNIDLQDVPTTAGCPAFAYRATTTATAVARAIAAGAIPIGKTNLDQFATGLVGTRSPYGTPQNPFDPTMIPGGSSSGSAVAVAAGLVSFAFGTDTAGSGRVPAALNNIVGLKPTRGRISTTGVVPACRTLDCVSLFALTCDDAAHLLDVVAGFDVTDPFSRRPRSVAPERPGPCRIAVPAATQLEFFGNVAGEELFHATLDRLRDAGHDVHPIDLRPFLAAARLLYDGPWVAERYGVVRRLLDTDPAALLPITRAIVAAGAQPSALDTFDAYYQLRALQRAIEPVWTRADVLITPTVGASYSRAEIAVEPVRLNSQLGYYTNFVNLLDLCGVAVPAGFQPDGLPFGITVLAPPFCESRALQLAAHLHAAADVPMGALSHRLPPTILPARAPTDAELVSLVVCGAHMRGLPLNHQLVDRGARFLEATTTANSYRLVALPDGRPGLERVAAGAAIAVEVWAVPAPQFGTFVAAIPPPLGIGTIVLVDGRRTPGFLCESIAAQHALDITAFGGWRAYLARCSENTQPPPNK